LNAKAFFLEKIVTATGTAVTTGAITSSHWSGAIATFKSAPVSTLALGGSAAVNYTLGSLTGSVAIISPANLTITANNRSKTYEQLLNFGSGATQFTSNGLRNGESIDSVTLTCAGGAASAAASTYPITPSAATGGTFSAGNYAITYSAGLLTVNALATTTTLSSSGSSTLYGEAVTLTATMSPNPDGGSVQFYDNSVALGTPVPLSGGQAQRVTSSLTTGSHSITAVYSGSTNFGGSAATAISQVVSKALATITTPPSASAITFGQTLASSTLSGGVASVPGSFTFTAPATAPNAGTAPQSVTFTPSDAANYQNAATSVDVTVNPALTNFATWAADPAQGLTAGVNNLPDDDPDHDGFSNLLEFALGGAPMISSQAIRPQLESTGGIWSFSYDRNVLSKSSTTQIVEYGSNLTGWTPLPVPATSAGAVVITPGASTDHVKVSIPSLGANGFVRLKVSQ
jgi:predicted secreted protein